MFPVSIKGVLQSPEGLVVLMLNERDEWELPGGRIELGRRRRNAWRGRSRKSWTCR